MPPLCSSDHGCVEDHPALLLQLPMRIYYSYVIPPSAHVLCLPSNHLYCCELDHHPFLILLDNAPVVFDLVPGSVLAFSLAECDERLIF
jgi:hypothetical protein